MAIDITAPTFIQIEMTIVDSGRAKYNGDIPVELGDNDVVSSTKFNRFQAGQTVQVAFRVTNGHKRVAHVSLANLKKTVSKVTKTTGGDTGTGYYMPENAAKMFNVAKAIARDIGYYAALLVGPSGFGKTTLGEIFASQAGMEFFRFDSARVRDPEEWFGTRELRDGETVFLFNDLVEKLQQGNTVIVFDELNRVEPWLHNALYRLLDSGTAVVHGQEITIGKGTIILATINQGFVYTGTFELDEALANRMGMVLAVGPLPEDVEIKVLQARTGVTEDIATQVVSVISRLRNKEVAFDVSTRTSLNVSRIAAHGVNLPDAFNMVLAARLNETEQKNLKDALRMGLF